MSVNKLWLMAGVCLLSEISFAAKQLEIQPQRRVSHRIQRTHAFYGEISPFERGIEKALSEIMRIQSGIACGSIAINTRQDFISNVMIPIDNTVAICLDNQTETQKYCDGLQNVAKFYREFDQVAVGPEGVEERNEAGQTLLKICDFSRRCQQDPNLSCNFLNGLAAILGIECPAE